MKHKENCNSKMKRNGTQNGRYKGVPKEAESFFITGKLAGLSARTLSVRWRLLHGEKIDHRRIDRWLKEVKSRLLLSSC